MTTESNAGPDGGDPAASGLAFTLERTFAAPRADVWAAWTDARQLARWWGPAGCQVKVHRLEFRPGGFFHYEMRFDGAPSMWGRFTYRDIVQPERIEWLNSFSNERCGIARAPFSAVCPLEILNTVTFSEDRPGHTTVRLRAVPFGENDAERAFFLALHPSLEQGYGGTLDQLAAHLQSG